MIWWQARRIGVCPKCHQAAIVGLLEKKETQLFVLRGSAVLIESFRRVAANSQVVDASVGLPPLTYCSFHCSVSWYAEKWM
jgi:hypothetical protein